MGARTTQYAEALARTTTSSATYQDKTTLTFTPEASSDYYFMHSAVLDNSTTTLDTQYRLQDTTASVTFTEINKEAKDSSDIFAGFGLYKYTSSGSPVSTTFKLQFAAEGGTAGIADARLWAIKANAADTFGSSDGESTDSVGTYTIKATNAFTPGTTGDYLIIAYAEVKSDDTATSVDVKLTDATTSWGESNVRSEDATSYIPWGTVVKASSLTGILHTYTIQFKTASATKQVRIRNARILAFRLDAFDNSYYAESRGRSTTTNTSVVDKTTLTQTTLAKKHVVMACGLIDDSSTTISSNWLVLEGSTISTGTWEGAVSTAEYPFLVVYEKTFTAASQTWKTQYFSETNSATTGISESAIVVLQIETSATDAACALAATAAGSISATLACDKQLVLGLGSTGSISANLYRQRLFDFSKTSDSSGTLGLVKTAVLTFSQTAVGSLAAALDIGLGFLLNATSSSSLSATLNYGAALAFSKIATGSIAAAINIGWGLLFGQGGTSSVSATLAKQANVLLSATSTSSSSTSLKKDSGASFTNTAIGALVALLDNQAGGACNFTGNGSALCDLGISRGLSLSQSGTGVINADLTITQGNPNKYGWLGDSNLIDERGD